MPSDPTRAFEVCRDRVSRAAEIRDQIGGLWAEYIACVPRCFGVTPGDAPNMWDLVLLTNVVAVGVPSWRALTKKAAISGAATGCALIRQECVQDRSDPGAGGPPRRAARPPW